MCADSHPEACGKHPNFLTGDIGGAGHAQPLCRVTPPHPEPGPQAASYTLQGGPKAHPAAEATEAWRSGACPGGSGHREDPGGHPQLPMSFATCLPAGLSGPCCHRRGQPRSQRSACPWGGLA